MPRNSWFTPSDRERNVFGQLLSKAIDAGVVPDGSGLDEDAIVNIIQGALNSGSLTVPAEPGAPITVVGSEYQNGALSSFTAPAGTGSVLFFVNYSGPVDHVSDNTTKMNTPSIDGTAMTRVIEKGGSSGSTDGRGITVFSASVTEGSHTVSGTGSQNYCTPEAFSVVYLSRAVTITAQQQVTVGQANSLNTPESVTYLSCATWNSTTAGTFTDGGSNPSSRVLLTAMNNNSDVGASVAKPGNNYSSWSTGSDVIVQVLLKLV